ncbi:MAG: DUF4329 domain-containing protein [Pseudomonadota bacterium]
MLRLIALLTWLALPALGAAQPSSEMKLARDLLSDMQERSIRESREFCGMIGVDRDGRYVVGPIARGTAARCTFRRPRTAERIVASFHTHGGFLAGYDNEVPSIIDLESERAQGLRGYVATPGGRFWLVDGVKSQVTLICGPKCLPWDPRFEKGEIERIRKSYTRQELFERAR